MHAVRRETPVDTLPQSEYTNGLPMDESSRLLDDLFVYINSLAFREGDFTLASGKRSAFYFDGKKVLFHKDGALIFARWLLAQLEPMRPRPVTLGGLEIGAIPIATVAMAISDFPLNSFVVRKKAKEHGSRQRVEGEINPGDLVAIVDDVITTGTSTLEAIRAVEAMGCKIAGIFCLMDRQEGQTAEFDRYRDIFHPAFTLEQFVERRRALALRPATNKHAPV